MADWFADPAAQVALAGFCLTLLYFGIAWALLGRDPKAKADGPRATPPHGLSPAALRYVRRMGFDMKAFAAALISMGEKGYLLIEETERGFRLRKKSGDLKALSPGERAAAEPLLYTRSTLIVESANYKLFEAGLAGLRRHLAEEIAPRHFARNGFVLWLGIALILFLMSATALASADWTAFLFLGGLTVAGTALLFALAQWLVPDRYIFPEPLHRSLRLALKYALEIGFIAVATPLALSHAAQMIMAPSVAPATLVLTAATAGLAVLFYHLMKAPSLAGRKVMDEIEAFIQHLKTDHALTGKAGADETGGPRAALAVALDVVAAIPVRSGAPSWYRGPRDPLYAAVLDELGDALTKAVSAAALPPATPFFSSKKPKKSAPEPSPSEQV